MALKNKALDIEMRRDTLTFAYGITNAGKTFTIQGDEDGGDGRDAR